MEIDPNAGIQTMIEQSGEGMKGQLEDIAFAIPGSLLALIVKLSIFQVLMKQCRLLKS